MKKILIVFVIVIGAMSANAQAPKGDANKGDFYGEKPSAAALSNPLDVDDLSKKMKSSDTLNVAIQGKVLEVCEKKGCWITLKGDDGEEIMVKMKDYGFFVPTALKGKKVVLDGVASMKSVSVAEQKHYAEDAKKNKAEIDAIKEPKTEIRYLASGIEVVN